MIRLPPRNNWTGKRRKQHAHYSLNQLLKLKTILNDQIVSKWRLLRQRSRKIKRLSWQNFRVFKVRKRPSWHQFSVPFSLVVRLLWFFKLQSFRFFLHFNPITNELRILVLFIDSLHLLDCLSSLVWCVWLLYKSWVENVDDLFFSLSKNQYSFLERGSSWVAWSASEQVFTLRCVYRWRVVCDKSMRLLLLIGLLLAFLSQ